LTSVYTINSTNQYTYTPLILTITPAQSGIINLVGTIAYRYNSGLTSMTDFGYYVSTSATAPGLTTAFTSSTYTAGNASVYGTAFACENITMLYSFNVVAGQTYYIYIGALDGTLSNQTAANLEKPRVIATFSSTAGL